MDPVLQSNHILFLLFSDKGGVNNFSFRTDRSMSAVISMGLTSFVWRWDLCAPAQLPYLEGLCRRGTVCGSKLLQTGNFLSTVS